LISGSGLANRQHRVGKVDIAGVIRQNRHADAAHDEHQASRHAALFDRDTRMVDHGTPTPQERR